MFTRLADAWHRQPTGSYVQILRFQSDDSFGLDEVALDSLLTLFDQLKFAGIEINRNTAEIFLSEAITLCQVGFHPITGPKLLSALRSRPPSAKTIEVPILVDEYALAVAVRLLNLAGRLSSGPASVEQRLESAGAEITAFGDAFRMHTDFTNFFVFGCIWQRGARISLLGSNLRYYLIGEGNKARMLHRNTGDRTSFVGQQISDRKDLCNELFARLGLPVVKQLPAPSEDMAAKAAEQIGFPVVVKPVDGGMGRGVAINLNDQASVRSAWNVAREFGRVIIEEQCPGEGHRFLVVNGKLAFALLQLGPSVIGDGTLTISQLLDQLNIERAKNLHNAAFKNARIDDPVVLEVLGSQDLTPDSVPEAGRQVWIRRNSNLSTGGILEDWTDRVHPDNAQLAEQAAYAVGVDICGVDLILQDASRSWKETGGVICEVNATAATAHDAGGQRIAEYLVPEPGSRISKTVFLTDRIDTMDLQAIFPPFFKKHPDGAVLTADGAVHSPLPLIISGRLSAPKILEALISNRQIGAIGIQIDSANLLDLAARLGPIGILVADQPYDLPCPAHLPFLADVKLISLKDFAATI